MDKPQERVLIQYGDREIWHADAEDGSWQLPLFIDWRHDKADDLHYAHITQALCFYPSQILALTALFQVHDILGRQNQWLIPRRICEAILRKAPGITVLRYYKWPGMDCPPIEAKPPLRARLNGAALADKKRDNEPIRRSFVQWLAKERNISSSIINAVLDAVAWDAPVWMVENRRPLDLGFCRLFAAPFRANWKEIVVFKSKRLRMSLRSLLQLPERDIWNELEAAGLPAILTSPSNIALRRGRKGEKDVARLDYSIEAIPTEAFESIVNRIENERMARGQSAYVSEFEDAVESLYKTLVLALRSYMSKIVRPHAALHGSVDSGVISFVPILGRHVKVRGVPLNELPIHLAPADSSFSVFGLSDDPRLVPKKVAALSEVSAVFPPPPDVREREIDGHLELLTDGEGDALRLPLPNEPKIEDC